MSDQFIIFDGTSHTSRVATDYRIIVKNHVFFHLFNKVHRTLIFMCQFKKSSFRQVVLLLHIFQYPIQENVVNFPTFQANGQFIVGKKALSAERCFFCNPITRRARQIISLKARDSCRINGRIFSFSLAGT